MQPINSVADVRYLRLRARSAGVPPRYSRGEQAQAADSVQLPLGALDLS